MNDLTELSAELIDIARAGLDPGAIQPGRIIAEFSSAQDARLFAGLKREAGESVTVTPGIHLLFAVRTLARPL